VSLRSKNELQVLWEKCSPSQATRWSQPLCLDQENESSGTWAQPQDCLLSLITSALHGTGFGFWHSPRQSRNTPWRTPQAKSWSPKLYGGACPAWGRSEFNHTDVAGLCYLSPKAHENSLAFLGTRTGTARDALAPLAVLNQQFPWKMMIRVTLASSGSWGLLADGKKKTWPVMLHSRQSWAWRCCSLAQLRAALLQERKQEKAFTFSFLSTSVTS